MRALRVIATAALVLALVGAPAAGASAMVSGPARMADGVPDFTPSDTPWRKWMINVTSKMLGSFTPDAWKAEQIANNYRYNYSWDELAARTGWSANSKNVNGDLMPIPKPGQGTYDDYVIAEYEKQVAKGGTAGKPFRIAATPAKVLVRGVGGAATILTAYSIGAMLGANGTNIIGGFFGWNSNASVCGTWGSDIGGAIMRTIAAQDCAAWDFANGYSPNGDAPAGYRVAGHLFVAGNYNASTILWCGPTALLPSNQSFRFFMGGSTYGYPGRLSNNSAFTTVCGAPTTGSYYFHQTSEYPVNIQIFDSTTGTVTATSTKETADPSRVLNCTITMTDGSSVSAKSDPYKESGGKTAVPKCPPTPAGKTPAKIAITEEGETPADGVAPSKVYEENTSAPFRELQSDYPECAQGACKLDLFKRAGSTLTSCFGIVAGCPDWFEDPAKADNYQCRYGTHDVAISECYVYSGLFQPGRTTVGAPWSDPNTGTWSGGQATPRGDQDAMGMELQAPGGARSCQNLASLWTDPVGFVMRPIQCAMEWQAIPRPLVAEVAFLGVKEVWDTKPPGVIAEAVTGLSIAGGPSGCSVGTSWHGVPQNIVDACGGPMAGLAAFTRLASLAVMGVLVFAKVRRQVAGMVNYNVGQD